jgi:hypothetical protein
VPGSGTAMGAVMWDIIITAPPSAVKRPCHDQRACAVGPGVHSAIMISRMRWLWPQFAVQSLFASKIPRG